MADDVGGAAAAAPAAPDPGAPAPVPAPAAAPTSVLGGGASAPAAAPAAPAAPADPNAWLGEKFRVTASDGAIDIDASARKVAEAYANLERRMGSGDAPPKTADEYKINVPEALASTIKADDLAKDEGFKAYLGKLHAAGASQAVVDAAVGEMLTRGSAIREALPTLAAAECETELRGAEGWKSDVEYARNIGIAFNAGKKIFGSDFDGIDKDYGNDPRLIRGLATIGREMAEDLPPSAEAQAQLQGNLDELMSAPAYLDARNPQHAAQMLKVEALTKRLTGTNPVAGGRSSSFRTG